MKYFIAALLVLLIGSIWYLYSPKEVDYSTYEKKISDQKALIAKLNTDLKMEKLKKDTIEIEILRTITLRDTIIEKLKVLPDEDIIIVFDSITTGEKTTVLTEVGVIVEMERIRDATIKINEGIYAKKEIALKDNLIDNLEGQVYMHEQKDIAQDSLAIAQGEIIKKQVADIKKKDKALKWLKTGIVVTTTISVIAIVF